MQLEIPHAIADYDYNGMHTGELSFQVRQEIEDLFKHFLESQSLPHSILLYTILYIGINVLGNTSKLCSLMIKYTHHLDNQFWSYSSRGRNKIKVTKINESAPGQVEETNI